MFQNDEQRSAYYRSGYTTLTDFLTQAFDSDMRLFETEPGLAYTGAALGISPQIRSDFLQAKARLLRHAASLIVDRDPAYIEFGVRAGASMATVSEAIQQPDASMFGLDTFTGLPDGWVSAYGNRGKGVSGSRPIGAMAVEKMPDYSDRRIILIKGLFQDTLPLVLPQLRGRPVCEYGW